MIHAGSRRFATLTRTTLIAIVFLSGGCGEDSASSKPLRLSVMTFNTWGAGTNEGKPIDDTVAAIRAAQPDIVGLQEVRAESEVCQGDDCPPSGDSAAAKMAKVLGYFVYEQQQKNDALWANAVISRYPPAEIIPGDLGVVFEIEGRRIAIFNIHLTDYPYQPYQLLQIPYSEAPFIDSESAAIDAANSARGEAMEFVIATIADVQGIDATFVTGDFNEPSHRDWTMRAAESGRHPLRMRYPTGQQLENVGFIDSYRQHFPDEMAMPGFTWTPTTVSNAPDDHHDRIDYVFVRGDGISIESSAVVGESAATADIVAIPWPSDHRAVVTTVLIP